MVKRTSRKAGGRKRNTAPARRAAKAQISTKWTEFAAEFRGHPALDEETIYALPERLITSICEEGIRLFSPEEERFERALSRIAGVGFYKQSPIHYPLLATAPINKSAEPGTDFERRNAAAGMEIQAMLEASLRRSRRTPDEIEQYFRTITKVQERVRERQLGYAGWLATEPAFRNEVAEFRDKWGARVRAHKRLPVLPISLVGEKPRKIRETSRSYFAAYMLFYRRWGLEALATWDLPIPMRPELAQPSLHYLPDLSDAGVMVFLPWYLIRDKEFTIAEIASHKAILDLPWQLEAWTNREQQNWGYERYAAMLKLYIYLELGLKQRYGTRLMRKTEALDRAFADYLYGNKITSADSVKKTRQQMNRRLKGG